MDIDTVETVLVAGASGDTGRELLRLLGPRVPTVRALTRSSEKRRSLRRDGADEVIVDDLLAPTALDSALDGLDVVVSAVGSEIGEVLGSRPFVDGAGVQELVDAAVAAGVEAFVMESAIGVGEEPASPLATGFDLFIGPIQTAKAETEAALRSSPLRHTIFRPGVLTNGPRTDSVTVAEPGAKLYGTVSRADVARLLAAAPVTDGAANATCEVVGRPSFPDRAAAVDWQLPATGRTKESVGIDVIDSAGKN